MEGANTTGPFRGDKATHPLPDKGCTTLKYTEHDLLSTEGDVGRIRSGRGRFITAPSRDLGVIDL